VSKNTLKSGVS